MRFFFFFFVRNRLILYKHTKNPARIIKNHILFRKLCMFRLGRFFSNQNPSLTGHFWWSRECSHECFTRFFAHTFITHYLWITYYFTYTVNSYVFEELALYTDKPWKRSENPEVDAIEKQSISMTENNKRPAAIHKTRA